MGSLAGIISSKTRRLWANRASPLQAPPQVGDLGGERARTRDTAASSCASIFRSVFVPNLRFGMTGSDNGIYITVSNTSASDKVLGSLGYGGALERGIDYTPSH